MANLIGQKLGNYEVTGFLGEGGMASVYRARQITVNRDVAIKVIKAGGGDTAEFMKRFAREAQTVAGLNHPHILKVFDYGQQGDLVYLVMELQPGGSLAALIQAGRLPTARISTILDQVASALDYAHKQGIIHRDLKPQNILLDPNGNAILTDFGIAKLLNSNTAALTQSGAAIGTPTYMAPEQWQGLPVDARTDIYALGVVLFQMVSGQLPFQGDTPFSVMHKHIYDTPPSLVSDRPQLPPTVDLVVRTAMAKDPEDRYRTAEELAQAFKSALVAPQNPTKRGTQTGDIYARVGTQTGDIYARLGNQMAEQSEPGVTPGAFMAPPHDAVTDPPGPIARTQALTPPPASRGNNSTLLIVVGLIAAAIILIGGGAVVLGSRTGSTPTALPSPTSLPTVAVAIAASTTPRPPTALPSAIPTTAIPPTTISTTAVPSTTKPTTAVPTTAIPTKALPTTENTVDPRETSIAMTQVAIQTLVVAISNAQAQFTATAVQAIAQASTLSVASITAAAVTMPPTTAVPTLAPATLTPTSTATTVPTLVPATLTPTSTATAVPTLVPATLTPTSTATASPLPQSVGTITFANQAKGAFLDSLTISMVHLPLAGEGKQYVVWLSDRTHAPLNLGKLLVRADGTARLTYADPKGANLLATYSVAYIISQSSATPTAQDPVVFSGALPPLASVHVQHVLTQFPDTPGNVGLMIGALQQAEVLTEHANLLAVALKQNDVTLTKAHMEHIYNILTGKEGAKDINGDGILTISPPGDGYGLLNYLTNAVEHATLAVQQPDATDSMKLAAKWLGTAVANITANYTKIQVLLEQASTKKAMVEIKPLMERVVALNNIAMNGTAAGTATPDADSAQFDGLLNAFDQAAALGAINFFPGDAALKISGTAAVQTTIQAAGALIFANQAKGAFFDSLTMNLTHMRMAVGVQQYIAWLSDLSHAPLKLGKLQVNTDGSAQLTYADPKGANLLAQYSVAYVTIQAGDNATAQDPVVFSGALPPLAGVHVQHVLTQFPDTPGNIGLMIGALQQAEVLTEHANLLAVALKQNDVTLTKAHMEHIYNILTGKEGAKDINGDGILTISPPGDGYGLLNYLTNAVEHATLAVQQPDATDAMKLTAKRLGTAVANITANYIKIQTLLEQASTKKAMVEIKPLMERVVALNNTAMNGAAAGNATPDPDSAKFDGLLNAFNQAAILGTIVLFPGDAALKTATAPGAATTISPAGTAVATMAGMSMAAPTVVTVQPLHTNTPTAIPANTVVIQLQGETFVPGTITVKVGTLIVFSNQSTEQHTATSDDGSFATGVLQPGTESKPILMSKPGTYAYFCEFHGGAGHVGMSGVIIVQ